MRDYDPTTGRYIQADPLGLVDGASVFGYALQSPARYIDPRGEAIPAAVGAAAWGYRAYRAWRAYRAGVAVATVGGVAASSPPASPTDQPGEESATDEGEMCEPDDDDRCKRVYQKCARQCSDYFADGPFPGHSGAAQQHGIRSCIRECMIAHDRSY